MATDSRIGSELAGYRIEGVLGRGGMSVVYLARHQRLDRRVALKVLAPDLAEDQRFRERFIRESRIAAGIEHPNIIPVYEAGEADGVLYIAMRYVRGTDLKSLVRTEGKLAPARAMAILAQVGSALDAAHADHLIHRDVKPANILIAPGTERSPEHVYLSDFGLTKRSSSDSGITATGQFVGTLDYAAPEQFEGKPLGPRTDTYSLGCVLYEVLTGEVPFRRDQDAAMMFAHLLSPPPTVTQANPDLPPGIDPVVARAMAKKPEDRYPTAGELVADARSALGVASGEFATLGGAPPRRRPRWLLPALAAALAAVVAIVAVVVSRGGGTPTPGPSSSSGPLAITQDAVARIDHKTNRLVKVIGLSGPPEAVTAEDGSIWAVEPGSTVARIDAGTGAVRIVGVGGGPTQITSSPGLVWTWDDNNAILTSISTRSGSAGTPFQVPVDFPDGGLAAGYGAVWVSGREGPSIQQAHRQGLFRIEPTTGQVSGYVPFPVGDVAGGAAGEGSVWLVTQELVHKIDPSTLKEDATIDLGGVAVSGAIPSMTVGAGSVWVASAGDHTLYRIDPATEEIAAKVHLPGIPTGVAVAGGHVWISLSEGLACEVDVGTNRLVATVHVGGIPVGVAIGPDGSPWVAAQKT
jgi:tRNA A-37 threonylcarbamoyl transferase component Bud32/streptogramin lyase